MKYIQMNDCCSFENTTHESLNHWSTTYGMRVTRWYAELFGGRLGE